jgi:hypothetical protein
MVGFFLVVKEYIPKIFMGTHNSMLCMEPDIDCFECLVCGYLYDPEAGDLVGATKSVEEMMAGAGIVIGCGEGLKRNRAAIRITRRMMPPIMSQGRRDRLDIY